MKKERSHKKANRRQVKQSPQTGGVVIDPADQAKRTEWVFMAVLLATGIYLSVVYLGQKAVPNSDFTAFVRTGQQVLQFQMPSSFKRVPVLGILQVAFGKLMVNSPHPNLTGALVLNGILYTLSILLFYKVSRFILEPTASFCLSLVAALNPWSLLMVVDPIAETSIVFFIMLTVYLIFRRSRWCYLAAMLASMTRYECFMLIGIALLFDIFDRKPKREKWIAFGLAFAAAVPMLLWLVGSKITTTNPKGHYGKHFFNLEHRNGFDLLKMLWVTSFSSLLQWPEWIRAVLIQRPASKEAAQAIQSHQMYFQMVWNIIAAVVFVLGVIWGFLKKQWKLLGLLLFWLGYVCIHMSQGVLVDRYTVPVIWLTLLMTMYGLAGPAGSLARRNPMGIYTAGAIGAVVAVLWTFQLWPAVSKTAAASAASANVAYAALLLAAIGLSVKQFICRGRGAAMDVCLFVVMALLIVSNQFGLSFRLGQGDLDIEFRKTAEWYLENTDGSERLVTTLPGVVNLFLPEGKKKAVHTNGIAGTNLAEFAQSCSKKNVKYVAWDSRLGLAVKGEYYKSWGLKKIHPLGVGRDVGPFKFITTIKATSRRYIHLYRFSPEPVQ